MVRLDSSESPILCAIIDESFEAETKLILARITQCMNVLVRIHLAVLDILMSSLDAFEEKTTASPS